MSTKHTPGPWKHTVYHNSETGATRIAIESPGEPYQIAAVHFNDLHNAHLIAAAPDLLEALQRALVALNVAFEADEDPFGVHHNDAVDAVSMAEVAIAKATNTTKH